jgi:hypothetical protein
MPEYKANIKISAIPTELYHAARMQDLYDLMGAKFKDPVVVATTGNLNADYDPADKTLILKSSATKEELVIDGYDVEVNERVLVANQSSAAENGIYVVTNKGSGSVAWVLTRAADFDETGEISTGVKVHVIRGDSNADATFVLTTDNPALNTTVLEFSRDTGKIVGVKEAVFTITAHDTLKSWTFTHNFDTFDVTVDIIEQSATNNYPTVYAEVTRPTNKTITVVFDQAIGSSGSNYKVIVRANV